MIQVGAQNQNATGLPATDAPSNSPLPTRGAVNRSVVGIVVSVPVSCAPADYEPRLFDPHAMSAIATAAAMRTVR